MARDARLLQRRLGERIQALRARRGFTQDELARASGISQKYLSELERGAKTASLDTLFALAHHGFRIPVAALVATIDGDLDIQLRHADELLAGWSELARDRVLRAIELLLEAGSTQETLPAPRDVPAARAAEASMKKTRSRR